MTDIIVPWRPGVPERERAFEYVRRWHEDLGYTIVTEGDFPGWSRARAVNLSVNMSTADPIVVIDADTFTSPGQLATMIDLASAGPGLVVGHTIWRHLTTKGTNRVLAGNRPDLTLVDVSLEGGVSSAIAFSRETWLATGGFPDFEGWGYEDVAFENIAATLAAPTRYVDGPAWHLNHPGDPNRPPENLDRLKDYLRARGDREAMLGLVSSVQR